MSVLLALLLVPCADAYELSGHSYAWQETPVEEPFNLNLNSFPSQYLRSEVEDGFKESLFVWNTQGRAGFELAYGSTTTVSQWGSGSDGSNTAMYAGSTSDASIALTARTWSTETPSDIVDCDTQYYGSNIGGAIVYDFAVDTEAEAGHYHFVWTAVHEMGHCLGLSHSLEPSAVMRPTQSAGLGPDDWVLTDDDIAGVQDIYGSSEPELAVTAVEYEVPAVEEAPGSQFELAIRVANDGSGTAFDVMGNIEITDEFAVSHIRRLTTSASMGDMRAGDTAGTAEDALRFDLQIPDDCLNPYDVPMELTLSDSLGSTWTHAFEVSVECPEPEREYVDDISGTWGPGCTTVPGAGWLAVGLMPLLVRRRRA